MLLRRLLTFALAGLLVFETPAAAYAAGMVPVVGDDVSDEVGGVISPADNVDADQGGDRAEEDFGGTDEIGDGDTEQDVSGTDQDVGDVDQGEGDTEQDVSGADQDGGDTEQDVSGADQDGGDVDQGEGDTEQDVSGNDQDSNDIVPGDLDARQENNTAEEEAEAAGKTTTSADGQTEETEKQHEFSVSIAEDFTTLTLQAVLRGYGEEAADAVLTYEYKDALGRVQSDTDTLPTTVVLGEDGSYTLTKTVETPVLLAEEVYGFKVKVQLAGDDAAEVSQNIEVTAPSAYYDGDRITFTCASNGEREGQVDYELVWEQDSVPAPKNVLIYYRPQGSAVSSYRETTAELSDGIASHSISGLRAECTYEFEMFAGGVRKSCIQEFSKSTGISLSMAPEGENETGAYDVTRTLKLTANDDQPLADVYYVTMLYAPKGGKYVNGIFPADDLKLEAENDYELTINTAAYSGVWLHPDTDYSICWRVTEIKGSAIIDAVLYDAFHTRASTVAMESIKSGHATQRFRVTMAPADVVNMQANGSQMINLYPYLKKKDSIDFYKAGNARVQLTSGDKYSNMLDLSALEEDTEYELSLRDEDNIVEYARTSFRTQPDYRTLSQAEVHIDVTGSAPVTLQARLNDNVEEEMTTVQFYYRKTNEAEPQKWIYMDRVTARDKTQLVKYTSLKFNWGVTYDYAIVLSKNVMSLNPDSVTREGWKLTGQFRVPEKVAIEKITLSQQELLLNAAFPNEEGYGRQTLKVTLEPADATPYLFWSTSNQKVATVDSSGVVRAVGVGEATITAMKGRTSADEEIVYASCKVIVDNYQVRYQEPDNAPVIVPEGNRMSVPKNKTLDGKLVLYHINADGTETAVPEELYTVEVGNTTVVQRKDDSFQAQNVGSTKLLFTTKGIDSGSSVNVEAQEKAAGSSAGRYRSYITWETLAAGKRFRITGMEASNEYYPAVEDKDGYLLACGEGVQYTATGEISSGEAFDPTLFTWKMEDGQTATVDEKGVITPIAAGETLLIVEPKETGSDGLWAVKEPVSIPIIVTQIPESANKSYSMYTLINMHKTLGEVTCPIEGWEWEYPDTPLVLNGTIGSYPYTFQAICRQDGNYPQKRSVYVYAGEVTGMSVSADDHEGVVEVSGADEKQGDVMTLQIDALYRGTFNPYKMISDYKDIVWTIPKVAGLQITAKPNGNGKTESYTIRAEKPGNYTLKPTITFKDKNGKTKVLAQTSYKIKAVKDPQVKSVVLTPVIGEEAAITYEQESNRVVIDAAMVGKQAADSDRKIESFDVEAVVKDRNDMTLDTALTWKSSDTKVASVKASKDTHKVTVTLKGEGHAILTATAKDSMKSSVALRIEIRNDTPRVNVSKIKVNTAYDYTKKEGRELAKEFSGAIEILPVYGDEIRSVDLYDKDVTDQDENGLILYEYDTHRWLVCPEENMSAGSRNLTLHVETMSGAAYEYPLHVTMVEQRAKVTVKQEKAVNLFYINSKATFRIKVSGAQQGMASASWQGNGTGARKGFASEGVDKSANNGYMYVSFEQQNLELNQKNRPADPNVLKGTLEIILKGYKEPCTVNTSIKWTYKKPVIVTNAGKVMMSPLSDTLEQTLTFRNKTEGQNLYYDPDGRAIATYNQYYHSVVCDNRNVKCSPKSGIDFTYTYTRSKDKGKEKITFTLNGLYWREPLKTSCTITFVAPKAYLNKTQVMINAKQPGMASVEVCVKGMGSADLTYDDIIITGKNAKAEKLLSEDLLEIEGNGNKITVKPAKEKTALPDKGFVSVLPAGTYAYKAVPYYRDANGVRQALNALTLKVKINHKEVTAKVKMKGSLDLTSPRPASGWTNMYNRIELTAKFNNMGAGYKVKSVELTGSYSQYFRFDPETKMEGGYLLLRDNDCLRAGQKYKLYLLYTIEMEDGESFKVTSAPFTVKPKQTLPKVKVTGNNQTLYASAEDTGRTYGVETLRYKLSDGMYYKYAIKSVYGSVDCNKDGIPDIEVKDTLGGKTAYKCELEVRITDRDGVYAAAGAKGKTYTIPITVKLKGRDGICKDVKTSIKVSVKR